MKQLTLLKKRKRTQGVSLGRPATTFTGARRKRPELEGKRPIHITLRLRDGLPNLRTRKGAQLIRHCLHGAKSKGLRVLHFAVLSNHIHILAECDDSQTLFRGMRSICTRMGMTLRKWVKPETIGRLGLFRGRYHFSILKSPQEVKNALRYVLLNPSKHFQKGPYIDKFTSASAFRHWSQLIGRHLTSSYQIWFNGVLSPPGFWLSQRGWMKAKY